MSQPTVCCVMLTRNREELAMRALACFRAQTYERKRLLVVNSGAGPLIEETDDAWEPAFVGIDALSIGEIRNVGNRYASHHYVASNDRPEIFIHWDDDDWSHPNRIAEQVALLQSSGKQCVGYRDMLFWRTLQLSEKDVYGPEGSDEPCDVAEDAWLYSNNDPRYCLGTSLCYWRETWERRPFPDLPKKKGGEGEDVEWLREVDSMGESAGYYGPHNVSGEALAPFPESLTGYIGTGKRAEPRMIASIHGANTQYYDPATYVERGMGTSWKRAAEWDEHCQTRMRL